jgi:RNA polymerase sigma factor (sigma-70 family)
MAKRPLNHVVDYLHQLADTQPARAPLDDGELLQRFLNDRDEGAFQQLLRRHGPMVLATCRRILGDAHEAEDGFQATFLILARKGRSILKHGSLGTWLHRVAYHVAINARARAVRQLAREREVAQMASSKPETDPAGAELSRLLDEELRRLPDKYRAPLVLCYLEGKTHEEAARELHWPTGSMSRRLARGQQLLQQRLLRRGLVFSVTGLTVALNSQASHAAVPLALLDATTRAAVPVAAGKAAAGVASANVAALMEETVAAMSVAKIKVAVLVFLAVALATAGVAVAWPSRPEPAVVEDRRPESDWGEPVQGVRLRVSCDRDTYHADRDLVRVMFAVQNVSSTSQHVTLLREGEEFTEVRLIGPDSKEYVVTGNKAPARQAHTWAGGLGPDWVERVGMALDPTQIAGGLPPGKYRVRGWFRRQPDPNGADPRTESRLESNETSFTLLGPTASVPPCGPEVRGCSLSLILLAERPVWKVGDAPLPFAVVLNRRSDDLGTLHFLQANKLGLYYSLDILGPDGHPAWALQQAQSAGVTPAANPMAYARLMFLQLDRIPVGKSMGERFEWDPTSTWLRQGYRREQVMGSSAPVTAGRHTLRVVYQLPEPEREQFASHPDAIRLVSNPIAVEVRD